MQHLKHYIGACLFILTLAVIALAAYLVTSCTSTVEQSLASVRNAFTHVLNMQPTITVNQQIVVTQTEPISELAVVTNDESIKLDFDDHYEVLSLTVPLTDKKITAEAVYHVKAGFDLHDHFTADINSKRVLIHLPNAKILSVEPAGDLTYKGDDSVLNRITDTERTQIINALQSAARDAAEKSTLKSDAETQVSERLLSLIQLDDVPIFVTCSTIKEKPVQ